MYTQKDKKPLVQSDEEILKLCVTGLTHSHVHQLFNSVIERGDIEIIGITEPNQELAKSYCLQYGFDINIVFNDIESMLNSCFPEAIVAFGSIYQHLEVVQAAAPRGIHVMVEKPLAVSLEHAQQMCDLATKHNIYLLTNYETTWYQSNYEAKEILESGIIGPLRKAIICDGHIGPTKLGVNTEFLDWLTDEKQNGGGAIMDFGCYGVNLMTWLMNGEKPISVTATTQKLQPTNYPNVDDESLIVLSYKNANAVVLGSWNWPLPRKDMELFGTLGTVNAINKEHIDISYIDGQDIHSDIKHKSLNLNNLVPPYDEPFSYFKAVIRQNIRIKKYDLSSLENNMQVVEILDAARKSAYAGKTVFL
ncbi:Gfo/Idh/MocA family protein [Vibrio parahaemolyticus]|uniref:Gfo/Idh/MocA family protein n=1 Tax=Vibrio parahaemolyticus TaxID=670 RepID=UPI00111D840F|nr:Gfo/Idh/MocA family oxidoreductase [Vibrio parahaemolyticus]TOG33105.1 oxidoreductase [Vibrio parahaemolyticus]HCM1552931.1 Gfo/Idh/MocA family oxidoreductase [Vibrio parahaemolyticus]